MLVSSESRPRNLHWYHAGPLLFGDWGTSRLYVLGLAFYYTAHASVLYLAVMSLIMAGVAWAYTVVCRCFPDGGGVYTAARRLSPTLSVVGATLLLCDYIVTASLSAIEGFHYLGAARELVVPLCCGAIVAIGIVNWFGARSAGRFALLIAIAAIAASAVIAVFCFPMVPQGLGTVTTHVEGLNGVWHRWESLVRIVLALSGLEAVANMTGLMREPVRQTARRTIWPVLIEVILLNLIFGLALNALPSLVTHAAPDYVTYELSQKLAPDQVPAEVMEYRDTALKVLATHAAGAALGAATGKIFGIVAGIIFGLLLLSAVNTAVMAMVSVQYSLAQDRELPHGLTKLNYSGVPWLGLIIACAAPAALLLIEADVKALAELYAIGVVGAIAINLLSCAANRALEIGPWERRGMWGLGGLMAAIELTIIVAKPNATLFAGVIVGSVLLARAFIHWNARSRARAEAALPEPTTGWMAHLRPGPIKVDPARPRIMFAARGRDQAEYAVGLAKQRGATLFAIYVRTLRVLDVAPGAVPSVADDRDAQASLGTVALLAREAGIPFVPIYVTTNAEIADEVLDYTATFACDTLIMGKSRRSLFSRRVAGDVVAAVASRLPEGITLLTRASGPFGSVSRTGTPPLNPDE